jgi:hypothetical protein
MATYYSAMADDPPSFESASVAAILMQRGREDRAALLDDLVMMLAEVVPGTRVERTLLGRRVTAIHLPVGGYVYVLRRGAGEAFEANRRQQVRGVAIRNDPMEIDAFLAELGLALDAELERTEQGRDALRRWLDGRNS